jgi:hypothetical protein
LVLFTAIAFFLYKRLIVLTAILVLAAITEYITSKNEMLPSLGHVFFLAMMMVKIDSLWSGLVIVLIAGLLPNLLLGSMNVLKITSYMFQLLSVLIFSLFPVESFVVIGLILSVLCYSLTFIIAKASGSSVPELIIDAVIPMVLNIIYFLSFASAVLHIVGNVILG